MSEEILFDSSGVLSPTTAILGESTLLAFEKLRGIATCLKEATVANDPARSFSVAGALGQDDSDDSGRLKARTQPGFHIETMQLNVSPSSSMAANTVNSIREVGSHLQQALVSLQDSLEEHMTDFYLHMKRKADEENAVLRSTQSKLPTSFQKSMHKKQEAEQASKEDSFLEGARSPQKKRELQQCADAVHSWLYLQLESLMEVTKATKSSVYLRSSDGYLRQVAEVPTMGEGTGLPTDVGLAAGSTLGTVYQTGVGVNILRSRFDASTVDSDESAKKRSDEDRQNVMSSSTVLKIRNGICMPLYRHGKSDGNALGVVVIADKEGASGFEIQDEHFVWGFCAAARGVLSRYPHTYLLSPPSTDPYQIVKLGAHLPPIHQKRSQLELKMPNPFIGPGVGNNNSFGGSEGPSSPVASISVGVPTIESHETSAILREPPQKASKQLIVRTSSGTNGILPKDLQSLPLHEVTEEAVLDSLAPYMRHIETLWRKALDTITSLRQECSRWDDTVNVKNNAIIEMEIQQKALQKQLFRVKNDVAKVKSVVPQHLRDQALIQQDALPSGHHIVPLSNVTSANKPQQLNQSTIPPRLSQSQKRGSSHTGALSARKASGGELVLSGSGTVAPPHSARRPTAPGNLSVKSLKHARRSTSD